jgi:hypothetical protein
LRPSNSGQLSPRIPLILVKSWSRSVVSNQVMAPVTRSHGATPASSDVRPLKTKLASSKATITDIKAGADAPDGGRGRV